MAKFTRSARDEAEWLKTDAVSRWLARNGMDKGMANGAPMGRVVQLANTPEATCDKRVTRKRKQWEKKRVALHEAEAKAHAARMDEPWPIIKR